jgi:DNA repair exonuclease SbcCD ATPase subunit
MKIIELKAQNIKRIKAVEIRPKDNVVVISGKNDQGKTSVLDSIWYALAGKDSLKNTPVPIRKGEKTAETTLTLDDFVVKRKWTDNDKTYLEVTSKDGAVFKSPQQLIDSFVGKLAFDPLEFSQMKEKEQRELLLGLIDLDINLDHVDTKIGVLYDHRRQKGQEVKLLQGQREDSEEGLPDELISIAELQEEYEKALSYNNNIDSIHARLIDYQHLLIDYEKQLEEIQKQIENTKINIKNYEKYLADKVKVDTDPIKQNINNAESINERIRARERNKEADKKLQQAQAEYDEFTKQIYALADSKKQALNKAKMPIKGLGINDTGVTYKGIPFGQLSSSEQLKVSMAIAVSFNPKLKVVLIRDGSLLDDDNMKIISEMAKGQDLQIWVERVNDQSGMAFVIEDGGIRKEDKNAL